MKSPSVGDVSESALVKEILHHSTLRSMAFRAVGASLDTRFWLEVPYHDLGIDGDGDVDALFVRPEQPQHSTAVEFKRVKVTSDTFSTRAPNKLTGLSKGVRQANRLAEAGFRRAMLGILVVTDGRERTDFNFVFRGADIELLKIIDAALPDENLHADVGVFRLEIVQPLDRPFTLSGGITGKLVRSGALREQPEQLTGAIERLIGGEPCRAAV